MSEFIIQGHKLTVVDGPQTTVHTLNSNEAAIALAAALEMAEIDERKKRLALMAKYANPDHPAIVNVPPADELAATLADLHNAEHPDDPAEVPEVIVPSSADPDSVVAEEYVESVEVLNAAVGEWGDPVPGAEEVVGVETSPEAQLLYDFAYEPDKSRVRLTLTSNDPDPVTVHRAVGNRKGDAVVDPGRSISRYYALERGETMTLTFADGSEIAEFVAPLPT